MGVFAQFGLLTTTFGHGVHQLQMAGSGSQNALATGTDPPSPSGGTPVGPRLGDTKTDEVPDATIVPEEVDALPVVGTELGNRRS